MSSLARTSFASAHFPANATSAFVIVPSSGDEVVNAASALVASIFTLAAGSATGDICFEPIPQQANVFFTTSQQPAGQRKAAFQALWRVAAPAMEQVAEIDVRSVQIFWMQLCKLPPLVNVEWTG